MDVEVTSRLGPGALSGLAQLDERAESHRDFGKCLDHGASGCHAGRERLTGSQRRKVLRVCRDRGLGGADRRRGLTRGGCHA